MPSVRIKDLIEVIIEEFALKYRCDPEDITIKIIGKRVGEKLYEELIIEEEIYNLEELEDMFIVYPYGINKNNNNIADNSKNGKFLSKNEIKKILKDINYFEVN